MVKTMLSEFSALGAACDFSKVFTDKEYESDFAKFVVVGERVGKFVIEFVIRDSATILAECLPDKDTPFVFQAIHDMWLPKICNVFLTVLTPALSETPSIQTLRQWRQDTGTAQARLGFAMEFTLKLASFIDPAMLLFFDRRHFCFESL